MQPAYVQRLFAFRYLPFAQGDTSTPDPRPLSIGVDHVEIVL
jgi:hypothetical protein